MCEGEKGREREREKEKEKSISVHDNVYTHECRSVIIQVACTLRGKRAVKTACQCQSGGPLQHNYT